MDFYYHQVTLDEVKRLRKEIAEIREMLKTHLIPKEQRSEPDQDPQSEGAEPQSGSPFGDF